VPAPTVEKPDAVDEPIPQREEFKPASTIEEAEQYAHRFAENVSYNKMSLETANIINQTLSELIEQYPTTRLHSLVSNAKLKRAEARSNFYELEIKPTIGQLEQTAESLKAMYNNRLEEYKKAIEKYPTMKSQYNKVIKQLEESLKYKRWTVGDNEIKATITHEYGHIIADQYCGQISSIRANPKAFEKEAVDMRELISQTYEKAKKNGDIYNISQYGASDKYEFFAETFTAHHLGEKLPNYIEDMLKGVLDHGAV